MAAAREAKRQQYAAAQQAKAEKDANTNAKRLTAADNARDRGDINLAVSLYLRLGITGRDSGHAETARERLDELAAEGERRLTALDAKLTGATRDVSPGEQLTASGNASNESILQTFAELDRLARQYRRIPKVGRAISTLVRKRRAEPKFAVVVNEPRAEAFWKLALDYDRKGQACCAIQVYEQAIALAPAPSALRAQERLTALKKDPRNIAAAKLCAELQRCHDTYRRAERLVKVRPKTAKALFAQILAQAPADSEIYKAARMQIAELTAG